MDPVEGYGGLHAHAGQFPRPAVITAPSSSINRHAPATPHQGTSESTDQADASTMHLMLDEHVARIVETPK